MFTKLTDSGRSEGSPPIGNTPFPSNHSNISPIPEQYNVRLVARDIHVLPVHPFPDIDYCPVVAVVRREAYSNANAREVTSPISRHSDHLTRVVLVVLQHPPGLLRDPLGEPDEPPAGPGCLVGLPGAGQD